MDAKLVVRKTPNCRHMYRATMKNEGAYGYGNTPDAARAKFYELRARFEAEAMAA